jgi:hypothetical protein
MKETKERAQKLNDDCFFDNEANFEPFSEQQYAALRERLLNDGYVFQFESENGLQFSHSDYSISALLTDRGLYFTASYDEESIFEAGMTASEFTDTGEFVKYNPQHNDWEEF